MLMNCLFCLVYKMHDMPIKCSSRTQFCLRNSFYLSTAASSLKLLRRTVVNTRSWQRIHTCSLPINFQPLLIHNFIKFKLITRRRRKKLFLVKLKYFSSLETFYFYLFLCLYNFSVFIIFLYSMISRKGSKYY